LLPYRASGAARENLKRKIRSGGDGATGSSSPILAPVPPTPAQLQSKDRWGCGLSISRSCACGEAWACFRACCGKVKVEEPVAVLEKVLEKVEEVVAIAEAAAPEIVAAVGLFTEHLLALREGCRPNL
jgi:hypothetical protein